MSTFGSSIFSTAMYECFSRYCNRYTERGSEVNVMAKPSPVTIGGQETGGSFVIRYDKSKSNDQSKTVQVWFIYLGVNDTYGFGERGYEITFNSTRFYDSENIEIRDQLLTSIKFL